MKIKFYKMMASGNDFIVIDNRAGIVKQPKKLVKKLSPRRTSVGADGVLLMEPSAQYDIKMRIVNADGSEAEMCGNGARCAALFSHTFLGCGKEFAVETLAGPIQACVGKKTIKIKLSDPSDYRDISPIEVSDGIFYFYFINTGVPHVVIFEETIDAFPVKKIGHEIRHHSHFEPQGTNVNFVRILDAGHIEIRTYERGVEDETLACGTGSTASAIVSALVGKCSSPIEVRTYGGERLKVSFDQHMYDIRNVYLEGKAQFIYEGTIDTGTAD